MKQMIKFSLSLLTISSVLLLQGCEVAYISKININETFSNSVNSDGTKNETIIKATFDDFCSKVHYSRQSNEYLFLEKNTEVISSCGRAWFHSARLWKKNGLYEIDLFLQQPGGLFKPTIRGYCLESKEMFEYFTLKFGASNVSIILERTCK